MIIMFLRFYDYDLVYISIFCWLDIFVKKKIWGGGDCDICELL